MEWVPVHDHSRKKEKAPGREPFLLVRFLWAIKENEHGVWGRDPTI